METFLKFGYAFQLKVLTSLLTDNNFIQQVSDVMKPSYFDSESKQWIVQTIFSHFTQYKTAPTLEAFKIKIDKEKIEGVLKQTIIDNLRDVNKHIGASDLQYIKDEAIDFCKNQCIKQAVLESVDLLEHGSYDKIKVLIDNAMKSGADKNVGHEYKEMIDQRYEKSAREVIPTPWTVINDITDGGFGKGELIVFVSNAGGGKCVGGNTKIDIEYEEIGLIVKGKTGHEIILWIKPWEKFIINDDLSLFGYELEFLLENKKKFAGVGKCS